MFLTLYTFISRWKLSALHISMDKKHTAIKWEVWWIFSSGNAFLQGSFYLTCPKLPETFITVITVLVLLPLHPPDLVQHLPTVKLVEHHHDVPHTLHLLGLLTTGITTLHTLLWRHSWPVLYNCTLQAVQKTHKGQELFLLIFCAIVSTLFLVSTNCVTGDLGLTGHV